jgi:hypothetical protein
VRFRGRLAGTARREMKQTALRALLGAAAGFSISYALALQFFDLASRARVDQWFLVLAPAGAVFVVLMHLLPPLEHQVARASVPVRWFILGWALISAFLPLRITQLPITYYGIRVFPLLLILSLLLIIPAAPFVQKAVEAKNHLRVFWGWLIATVIIFFIAGFLDNYYGGFFEFACLVVFLQFIVGLGGHYLVGQTGRFFKTGFADVAIPSALFLLLFAFIASVFTFSSQYPELSNPATFALAGGLLPVFVSISLLSLPWQAWMLYKLRSKQFFQFRETRFYSFVNENLAGISLALVFFALYLLIASILNHSRFDVDDVFFDADAFNWRLRLTTDNWGDYYWRSVHPFVLLLLKPPIDLAALFLKGDRVFGAYIIVALGGAACVFLAWRFIHRLTAEPTYALLTASLLGLSASHLIFGSLIETYIFLAASLILFYVLLAEDRPFPSLVMAGLATIGITHSNFAQNVIAFFTVKPNVKGAIRFVVTVLVFLVLLTLLNNLLYPASQPFFFIPSTLQAERQNLFPLNTLRIQALTRAFVFHNVVAPAPILYTGDIPFVQFRFFKPEINSLSRYETPMQNLTAWFWLALLALAALTWLINFRRNKYRSISLALLACILINAALHLRYGKELFLYSPNWTYALILLAGLGWQRLARSRWFHLLLLAFLALLAFNNGLLLREIIGILAEQV